MLHGKLKLKDNFMRGQCGQDGATNVGSGTLEGGHFHGTVRGCSHVPVAVRDGFETGREKCRQVALITSSEDLIDDIVGVSYSVSGKYEK